MEARYRFANLFQEEKEKIDRALTREWQSFCEENPIYVARLSREEVRSLYLVWCHGFGCGAAYEFSQRQLQPLRRPSPGPEESLS